MDLDDHGREVNDINKLMQAQARDSAILGTVNEEQRICGDRSWCIRSRHACYCNVVVITTLNVFLVLYTIAFIFDIGGIFGSYV